MPKIINVAKNSHVPDLAHKNTGKIPAGPLKIKRPGSPTKEVHFSVTFINFIIFNNIILISNYLLSYLSKTEKNRLTSICGFIEK